MKSQAIGQSLYHMNENTKQNNTLGSLITAKIVAKDNDHILLLCGDKKISAKVPSDFTGDIGQELDFEVMQQDGQITLRLTDYMSQYTEIDNSGEYDGKNARFVDFTVNSLQPKDMKTLIEERVEEHKEKVESLKHVKQRLDNVLNSATPSAVAAMVSEGIAMENITFEMLERVSGEVSIKPDQREEDVEQLLEQAGIQVDSMEKMRTYGTILVDAGLPVTSRNIESLAKLDSRMDELTGLDEKNIYAILQKMESSTLENLYLLKYSAVGQQQPYVTDETLQAMQSDIENLMALEGIDNTQENAMLAQEFIKHQVPVTKKHFDVEKILSQGSFNREQLLLSGAENIKQGKNIYDVDIVQENTNTQPDISYEELLSRLPGIDPQTVDQLLYKQIPVNLHNLMQEEVETQPVFLPVTQQEIALSMRRQLLEIQMKLTTEAASRLAGKDIDISTLPLQEALEEVKQAQKELATMSLSNMEVPATEENISSMEHVFDQKGYLRHFIASGEVLQSEDMEGLSLDNVAELAKKVDLYEVNQTDVNPKYKDHFGKVTGQFEDLLVSLNIDPSEANVTMAKSLSRNGIDVTPENILEAKLIDTKLKFIESHFHPAIAAKMIQEGAQPTQMHLDELIEYIHAFKDVYGENTEKYFARQIYEMDQSKAFSPTEREGILAVYRMLHQISKFDSAAIGAGLKSGHTSTIHNLWESSRFYDKTKANKSFADVKIDDAFGLLEEKKTTDSIYDSLKRLYEETSSSLKKEQSDLLDSSVLGNTWENVQLLNSMEQNQLPLEKNVLHQMAYEQGLLQEIYHSAQPENIGDAQEFIRLELEELSKSLSQKAVLPQTGEIQNSLKDLSGLSAVMFQYMQDKEIPTKVGYMNSFKKMAKNPEFISDEIRSLNHLLDKEIEIPTPEELGEYAGLGSVLSDLEFRMVEAAENINIEDIQTRKSLGQVQMALQLTKELYQKEEAVSFPVQLGNTLQTVQMFFLKDINSKETIQTVFHVNTSSLGTVQMYMSTSVEGISLTISAEKEENTAFLQSKESSLRALLQGENILDIQYMVGSPQTLKEKIEPQPLGENHIFDHYFETSI